MLLFAREVQWRLGQPDRRKVNGGAVKGAGSAAKEEADGHTDRTTVQAESLDEGLLCAEIEPG